MGKKDISDFRHSPFAIHHLDAGRKSWLVYLVRCADGTLYCGATNDLPKRLQAHNAGRGAAYTRGRLPVRLEARSAAMTRSEALRLEMKVKRVSKERKKSEVRRAKGNGE